MHTRTAPARPIFDGGTSKQAAKETKENAHKRCFVDYSRKTAEELKEEEKEIKNSLDAGHLKQPRTLWVLPEHVSKNVKKRSEAHLGSYAIHIVGGFKTDQKKKIVPRNLPRLSTKK